MEDSSPPTRESITRAQSEDAFPSIVRREDYRPAVSLWWLPALLLSMLGGVCSLPLILLIFAAVSGGQVIGRRRWLKGRKALRVDAEGVHELLPNERTRVLRWEEIADLRREQSTRPGWQVVPRDHRVRPILFDTRLEDAHAVASLINARLLHLPLLPPTQLPTPKSEEIEAFFGQPPPLQWRVPRPTKAMVLGAIMAELLALSLLGPWLPSWSAVLAGLVLANALAVLFLKTKGRPWLPRAYQVVVDQAGIHVQDDLGTTRSLSWQGITGRDDSVIKGMHWDLRVPLFLELPRLLQFVDLLLERRGRAGGARLPDKASEASLVMVEPEYAAEPSAAALAEVAGEEPKPRLTGREVEALGEGEGQAQHAGSQ